MNKNRNPVSELSNPNDSHAGCYAPVEHGNVVEAKKKHYKDGETIPPGWMQVDCDYGCQFIK